MESEDSPTHSKKRKKQQNNNNDRKVCSLWDAQKAPHKPSTFFSYKIQYTHNTHNKTVNAVNFNCVILGLTAIENIYFFSDLPAVWIHNSMYGK